MPERPTTYHHPKCAKKTHPPEEHCRDNTDATLRTEGWARPSNSRKFHFFREGRSLCRNFGDIGYDLQPTGNIPPGTATSVDVPKADCAECARRAAT